MKTIITLLVLALALTSGFSATTPAVPTAKIQSAASAKVQAYYKSRERSMGDARTKLISAGVSSSKTEPITGWSNRYRTSGTVNLVLVTGGKKVTEKRSYEVISEVSGAGAVKVLDLSIQ